MLDSDVAPIATDRLVLRPLQMPDAGRLAQLANDVNVARNMTDQFAYPYSRADAEEYIQSDNAGLAVERVENDEGLMGVIGANVASPHDSGFYRFGYWLGVTHWGNGYATEAANAYLNHVLNTENCRRIEASVCDWNPASARVLEKSGFELEARLKDRISRFGDVTDELLYVKFPSQ